MNSVITRDRVLGKIACAILGAILLFASYAKVLEPGAFVEQVHLEGLDFLFPATWVALFAIAVETGLGVLLLTGVTNRYVLAATGLLTLFFLYLTGRNYWLVSEGLRDPGASCGCFGTLIERTAAEAFWQDLLMLCLPLVVAVRLLRRESFFPAWRTSVAVLVAALATLQVVTSNAFIAAGDALHFGRQGQTTVSLVALPAHLFVDGEEDTEAKVYLSEGSASFVIVSSRFVTPVLLDPRDKTVRMISRASLLRDEEGSEKLSESPEVLGQDHFEMGPAGLVFQVGKMSVRLLPL